MINDRKRVVGAGRRGGGTPIAEGACGGEVASGGPAMHVQFFSVKRVHLQTLHVSRQLLAGSALTPARFDMMRIIELHEYGVAQSKLIELLGVCAPVVSVMLKSLEQLGFVTREICAEDRRYRYVHLTALGRAEVTAARVALIASGVADRTALESLDPSPNVAAPMADDLRRLLRAIRRNFHDPAPLEHPWRTGEVIPYITTTLVDGRICYGPPLQ